MPPACNKRKLNGSLAARSPIRVDLKHLDAARALGLENHFHPTAAVVEGGPDAVIVAVVSDALDSVAAGPAGNCRGTIQFNFTLSGRGVARAGSLSVSDVAQGGGFCLGGDGSFDRGAEGGVILRRSNRGRRRRAGIGRLWG